MYNLKHKNSNTIIMLTPVPLWHQLRTENYVYIVFVPNTCTYMEGRQLHYQTNVKFGEHQAKYNCSPEERTLSQYIL